jgi:predicted permease
MAMSLVLVVAAGLCVRSQLHISRVDVGFDLEQGMVARFGLDASRHPLQERPLLAERLVERITRIPGVTAAAAANIVPLGGDSLVRSFHPAGRTDIPGTRPSTFSVGPSYFRTMGIPLRRGQDFDASHVSGSRVVAIVNETYAETYFPNRDALGRAVQTEDEPEAVVIGVVRDHRTDTIGEAPKSVVYYPYAQRPAGLTIHARTSAPGALLAAMAQAVDDVDATLPVRIETRQRAASLELSMRRVATGIMGTMGGVGLLLAMVGLYGVMAYVAASRVPEVGIRMALGASAGRIRGDMLRRALALVGRGVAAGAALSLLVTPVMSTFLAGVSPYDPAAFAAAALLLAAAGLAAAYLPARQASKVDPIRALRSGVF